MKYILRGSDGHGYANLALHVALRTIALRLEGCTGGTMAGPAGGLLCLGGSVNGCFVVQWRFRVLLEHLVVTTGAITAGALRVRSVIEGHIPVLGRKR